MASALAINAGVGADDSGVSITLNVIYSGVDVPGGRISQFLSVYLLDTDQPAAIRSKISTAIAEQATAQGFTVAGGNMTIPTFQKG